MLALTWPSWRHCQKSCVQRFWLHMASPYHLQQHLQRLLPQKLLQHLLHSLPKVLQLQQHRQKVRQLHRLLRLLQDPQLMLQLLLQHQKSKATALILSSWLPCHQRFRRRSWSSKDESGVCESGSDSNSKQLLQRRREEQQQVQLQGQVQKWTWPPSLPPSLLMSEKKSC